ncbi:MAG: FecR domain-containing protein [Bacteroidota bacterium]
MKDNKKNIEEYLLIRYFEENCTNEEKSVVENWLNDDDQNRVYFNKLKGIWEKSQQAKKYSEIDIESSLKNVKSRINVDKQSKSKNRTLWLFAKVAAVVVLFLGIYAIIDQYGLFTNENNYVLVETNNDKKEILLPDGTIVFLNGHSKIEYPEEFNGSTRKLKFEGEAYFQVEPDKSKPFIIETKNAITRVLGTAFNLRAIPGDGVENVVVTHGKVQFTPMFNENKAVKLAIGEKATIDLEHADIIKEVNSDKNFLAWKTGVLVFENTPMFQAVVILSEHYNVEFKIDNENLSKLTINAEYDNLSIDDLIEILMITLNVEIEKENGVIKIY